MVSFAFVPSASIARLHELRAKLAKVPIDFSVHRNVVLEFRSDALTADTADVVIEADLAALETIPDLGARWPELYVKDVARHDDDLVILLGAETLFRPDTDRQPTADMRS